MAKKQKLNGASAVVTINGAPMMATNITPVEYKAPQPVDARIYDLCYIAGAEAYMVLSRGNSRHYCLYIKGVDIDRINKIEEFIRLDFSGLYRSIIFDVWDDEDILLKRLDGYEVVEHINITR